MCQSLGRSIGPDSLNCGKWRKILKSRRDLDDLDWTVPNAEVVRAIVISILQYVPVSSGLNYYLLSYRIHSNRVPFLYRNQLLYLILRSNVHPQPPRPSILRVHDFLVTRHDVLG